MKRRSFLQTILALPLISKAAVAVAKNKEPEFVFSEQLELPEGMGWARHIDGMRELRAYEVCSDVFIWRWDMIIDGEQYNYSLVQPWPLNSTPEAFSEKHRGIAKKALLARKAMRGKTLYIQNAT